MLLLSVRSKSGAATSISSKCTTKGHPSCLGGLGKFAEGLGKEELLVAAQVSVKKKASSASS